MNNLLEQIQWECEYTNAHFIILKERDYFSFTLKDEGDTTVWRELENISANEDIIDKMNILGKQLKRLQKLLRGETCHVDFATKSIQCDIKRARSRDMRTRDILLIEYIANYYPWLLLWLTIHFNAHYIGIYRNDAIYREHEVAIFTGDMRTRDILLIDYMSHSIGKMLRSRDI